MSIVDCVRSSECGCSNGGSGWRMIGVDLLQACCNSAHLVVGRFHHRGPDQGEGALFFGRDGENGYEHENGRITCDGRLVHFWDGVQNTRLKLVRSSSVVKTLRPG